MHHLLEECFVSGARFDRGVHRDAAARVVAGESATAVARDVGCRRGTVSQWCREAGWSWSGGVRAGLLRLTGPDAPESSRPSWVGRACPRPQPPLGCVGSRRAGTGHDQTMETASAASARFSGRCSHSLPGSACSGRVGRGQRLSDAERVLIAQGRARGESTAAIARSWAGAVRPSLGRSPVAPAPMGSTGPLRPVRRPRSVWPVPRRGA